MERTGSAGSQQEPEARAVGGEQVGDLSAAAGTGTELPGEDPTRAVALDIHQQPDQALVAAPATAPEAPTKSLATRASAAWTALALGMVVLVAVVVFILENLQDVKVTFFGAEWRVPLAIDLLLAAVLGGAVVFSAGAVRLLQLRLHARRQSNRARRRAA